jgi:hypothetical protein
LQTWSRRLTKCSYKMAMSYKMYTSYIQEDNRAGNLSGNHMATYPCVISFLAYLHTCSLVLPPTTQHEIESSKRHRECLTKILFVVRHCALSVWPSNIFFKVFFREHLKISCPRSDQVHACVTVASHGPMRCQIGRHIWSHAHYSILFCDSTFW